MNHIVLMGRLTRDPELRHTSGGVAVASYTLAIDRGYTSKDSGEKQTDFIDIVAWREKAEFVSKYFVKGQLTAVAGRLQINDWTDREGNKRKRAEVVADHVYFAESKKSRDANAGFAPARDDFSAGFSTPVTGSEYSELEIDDGELPF